VSKRDRAEIISSHPWKDLPTSCCEQRPKSHFLLLSIPSLNLFTLKSGSWKIKRGFLQFGWTDRGGWDKSSAYSFMPLFTSEQEQR